MLWEDGRGREGERKGEEGRGVQNWRSALARPLLFRTRMPESLAGNHLKARAIRQGSTGVRSGSGREGALKKMESLGEVAKLRS